MRVIRNLVCIAAFVTLPSVGGAVDIPMRDGSVLEAASYTATASYLIVTLPNGRQVAYDVVDVDVAALEAAERAAPPAEGEAGEQAPRLTDLAGTRKLAVGDSAAGTAGPVITDHDVGHVRADGSPLPEDEREEDPDAPPEDHEKGGQVTLKGFRMVPLGEGRWRVEGEVVNLRPATVRSVQVRLTASPPDAEPIVATVQVANALAPDEAGAFEHSFTVPGEEQPPVRFEIYWMQVGDSSTKRDRIASPNAVPPPQRAPQVIDYD